jgi:hypothetical protein
MWTFKKNDRLTFADCYDHTYVRTGCIPIYINVYTDHPVPTDIRQPRENFLKKNKMLTKNIPKGQRRVQRTVVATWEPDVTMISVLAQVSAGGLCISNCAYEDNDDR